jgi:hypothetical protein
MPEARDDDYLLWLKVIEKVAEIHNIPDFTKTMPFGIFLATAKYSKFPHYTTVGRARRKLQEKFPELRATAETQAARSELEESYKDFARNY